MVGLVIKWGVVLLTNFHKMGGSLLNDFGGEKIEKMENDPPLQLSTEE